MSSTAVATATAPVLELRGFSAGYDGLPVVHEIDLEVLPGEVVALLGPNGAGKTTTLLTISSLLPRLAGETRVFGVATARAGRRRAGNRALELTRRGLAHVPEDRALFFGLTGREHLRLAAPDAIRARSKPRSRRSRPSPSIIDRRAGLMSGGEQQMLAIARALAARPKLLMIDELSLGLAPIIVQSLLPR